MNGETEKWLAPLLTAMLSTREGNHAFARLMEQAITSHEGEPPGVDWIRLGQLIRNELGWNDYPTSPPPNEPKG